MEEFVRAAPGWIGTIRDIPFLLYGVLLICQAVIMYVTGVLMGIPRVLLGLNEWLLPLNEWIVWYSGVPMMLGIIFVAIDLFLLFPAKRVREELRVETIGNGRVTVALTAYNDELSIAEAVKDFQGHPSVCNVIVVSNNSTDETFQRAQEAGALVFNETAQGYGRCVYRCFQEALRLDDADLIVLCEGDSTFRAYDLDKLLAYAPHADIVNGTRIAERLRQYSTQLSTFMYYGNLFVAKLLEAKHLGRSTLTDVGTTYKLCRRDVLKQLMTRLRPEINLEFNAHFLDISLGNAFFVVECPITFHPRVGVSKGGNTSNGRALKVGLRMMRGILFGWPGR